MKKKRGKKIIIIMIMIIRKYTFIKSYNITILCFNATIDYKD